MLALERWVARLPVIAGPLAIAGFLLPWTAGAGPLTGESFSGMELIRVLGALQSSEPAAANAALLAALRLLILGVPVAATWVSVLAPAHRWHWAYPGAGAYLVVATAGVAAYGSLTPDGGLPLPGTGLLTAAAAALLAPLAARMSGAARRISFATILRPTPHSAI